MALVGDDERDLGCCGRRYTAAVTAATPAAGAAQRRVVHRVLGRRRRGRCRLVGILEKNRSAQGISAATAAGFRAMMRSLLLCVGLLCASANAGFAQTPPEPTVAAVPHRWESLSAGQQQLLQSYHGSWDSLPPERQQALARGSNRWLSMTPEQREGAQQRFREWRAMPPEQRQELRQRWRQFKSLPPEEQQRVREQYQQFRQRPVEQRRELRRQWRQMTPEQRHTIIERHFSAPHAMPPHAPPHGPGHHGRW
jgi:hypothetical protein